jgi:hypothetical protein
LEHALPSSSSPPPLKLVDSITELSRDDAGSIAVSGSHGGISSARYALAARPLLSVFNDAGVGKDGAGIAGLALLQSHGLAACTVAHHSARIGVAHSSWLEGVLSHVNAAAYARGLRVGHTCRQTVEHLSEGAAKH